GHVAQGLDDGVADEVGERHLPAPRPGQVVVQDLAVDLQQPGRHHPEAGGRGDGEAGLHVLDDAGPGAPDGLGARREGGGNGLRRGLGRGGGGLGLGLGGGLGLGRGGRRTVASLLPVVGEELAPTVAHGGRVFPVPLVHLVDEPIVGPERGSGGVWLLWHLGHRWYWRTPNTLEVVTAQLIFTMRDLRRFYPPDREVLRGINISMYPGAKIGVIGANGSGKSSLLRIMAGEDDGYTGEARLTPGFTVGYLPQEPRLDPAKDVLGNVQEGVAATKALLDRYNEVCNAMGDPDADFDKLLAEQGDLQDKIDAA